MSLISIIIGCYSISGLAVAVLIFSIMMEKDHPPRSEELKLWEKIAISIAIGVVWLPGLLCLGVSDLITKYFPREPEI